MLNVVVANQTNHKAPTRTSDKWAVRGSGLCCVRHDTKVALSVWLDCDWRSL